MLKASAGAQAAARLEEGGNHIYFLLTDHSILRGLSAALSKYLNKVALRMLQEDLLQCRSHQRFIQWTAWKSCTDCWFYIIIIVVVGIVIIIITNVSLSVQCLEPALLRTGWVQLMGWGEQRLTPKPSHQAGMGQLPVAPTTGINPPRHRLGVCP